MDYGFASFITIVGRACLARGHRSVVDQLKQVLSVAGDDGHLLAVLAQRVELVCVGGLDLLTGDVGELRFGDERLGFGADEFLLEDNNLGRVGLFVFQLCDLVCDLLLACEVSIHARGRGQFGAMLTISTRLYRGLNVPDALDSDAVLVVSVDVLVLEFTDFVKQHTKLVGDIGDILVASLTPYRKLLLRAKESQTATQ